MFFCRVAELKPSSAAISARVGGAGAFDSPADQIENLLLRAVVGHAPLYVMNR